MAIRAKLMTALRKQFAGRDSFVAEQTMRGVRKLHCADGPYRKRERYDGTAPIQAPRSIRPRRYPQ